MYRDFYGLREDPFTITPDPRFLYMTEQHRQALNHLLFGIREGKGFTLLTGEVGTGKTTLCRALRHELGPRWRTALIVNPVLSTTQLVLGVLEAFGVEVSEADSRLGYLRRLQQFLRTADADGTSKGTVLVIDEAQDLSVASLEAVRLLSNLETDRRQLLQIVLVGQPELNETLRRDCLRQLNQRITVRYHLQEMSLDDTMQYIHHRLTVAGAEGWPTFDRKAARMIYRYSRGTPRLVNALGDKSLLAGYVYHTGTINKRLVRLAAKELQGTL